MSFTQRQEAFLDVAQVVKNAQDARRRTNTPDTTLLAWLRDPAFRRAMRSRGYRIESDRSVWRVTGWRRTSARAAAEDTADDAAHKLYRLAQAKTAADNALDEGARKVARVVENARARQATRPAITRQGERVAQQIRYYDLPPNSVVEQPVRRKVVDLGRDAVTKGRR